jgi:hypothetical protein
MAELPPEAVQHTGPPHSTLLTECGDSDSHGDIHTVSPFSWDERIHRSSWWIGRLPACIF